MREKGSACDISRAANSLHARADELVQAHEEHTATEFPEVDVAFTPSNAPNNANNWIGQLCITSELDRYSFGIIVMFS